MEQPIEDLGQPTVRLKFTYQMKEVNYPSSYYRGNVLSAIRYQAERLGLNFSVLFMRSLFVHSVFNRFEIYSSVYNFLYKLILHPCDLLLFFYLRRRQEI